MQSTGRSHSEGRRDTAPKHSHSSPFHEKFDKLFKNTNYILILKNQRDPDFELGMHRFVKIDLSQFLRGVQEIDKIRRNRFLSKFRPICEKAIKVAYFCIILLPNYLDL